MKSINLRISKDLYTQLSIYSKKANNTIPGFIRYLITNGLANEIKFHVQKELLNEGLKARINKLKKE